MSMSLFGYFTIGLFLSLSMLMPIKAKADYQGPVSRTNINGQTDLFKRSIRDPKQLEQQLENNKSSAVSGLSNNPRGFEYITKKSSKEIESNVRSLEGIKASDLNSKGIEELAKHKEEIDLDTMYPDYTKPLNIQYKKDAEKIADGNKGLLDNLLGKLKNIGVDCRTVKGDKIVEPEYYLQVRQELTRDKGETFYDPYFCEQLRNQYNCTDSVTMRCAELNYVAGTLTNITGNMIHNIDGQGNLRIGVNREKFFWNSWGAQIDAIFSFEVSNPEGIANFTLLFLGWADHLLVKLNDHIVFQSAGVNGKIELSTDPRHYRKCRKEKFYGVDIGTGDYVSANTKNYFDQNFNTELKHLLKKGKNTFHLRMAYGNGAKLAAHLNYKERRCNSWTEEWTERCTLR